MIILVSRYEYCNILGRPQVKKLLPINLGWIIMKSDLALALDLPSPTTFLKPTIHIPCRHHE